MCDIENGQVLEEERKAGNRYVVMSDGLEAEQLRMLMGDITKGAQIWQVVKKKRGKLNIAASL